MGERSQENWFIERKQFLAGVKLLCDFLIYCLLCDFLIFTVKSLMDLTKCALSLSAAESGIPHMVLKEDSLRSVFSSHCRRS